MADVSTQEQISKEALKQVGEKQNPRGKLVANRMRELREEGARAVLENASGRERGVSGKRRAEFLVQMDGPRRAGAGANIDAHNKLLRDGYDALNPVQQDAQRALLKAQLDNSRMGDLFRGITDPAAVQRLTEDLFRRDPEFMAAYQDQMDSIINSRPSFDDVDIDARAKFLRADDPVANPDKKTARQNAREQILEEWRAGQEAQLNTLMADTVDAYIVTNIKRAQQASGEATSLVVADTIAQKEKLWHQPGKVGKEVVKQEFGKFMQGGGEVVVGKETWAKMSSEEREEFNKHYGEKMFTERLLAGKLNVDDMRTLGTAEWLGEDFPARVDRIRDMFEANDEFKRLIADGQARGTIDKNMWDKIKAAGPLGLAGAILALIGVIAFPVAAIPTALLAVGSGGAAGYGKYKFDEKMAA